MTKSVDALGKVSGRSSGRQHELVGKHSAPCARKKHEDWQHSMTGCAVGTEGKDHCECTAHWIEVVPKPETMARAVEKAQSRQGQ